MTFSFLSLSTSHEREVLDGTLQRAYFSLQERVSFPGLCFRFILLPPEAEGFEIIRETAGVGVVTGTHQLCSPVILRTTIKIDLSKSSAEQIDFDAL